MQAALVLMKELEISERNQKSKVLSPHVAAARALAPNEKTQNYKAFRPVWPVTLFVIAFLIFVVCRVRMLLPRANEASLRSSLLIFNLKSTRWRCTFLAFRFDFA